jgi:hypothetical protein
MDEFRDLVFGQMVALAIADLSHRPGRGASRSAGKAESLYFGRGGARVVRCDDLPLRLR